MTDRVRLEPDQLDRLNSAVQASGLSQRQLARNIGMESDHTPLHKFLRGTHKSLGMRHFQDLLRQLDLDPATFIPQLELPLDEDLISFISDRVRSELEQLRHEIPVVRGTGFEGFFGLRVEGTVEKVYEAAFPLRPRSSKDRRRRVGPHPP